MPNEVQDSLLGLAGVTAIVALHLIAYAIDRLRHRGA